MAQLKVRFRINQGRRGAPMGKLGRIAEQIERFLRALAQDNGVEAKPGDWLALDFENHSVEFQAQYPQDVDSGVSEVFSKCLEALADYDSDAGGLNGTVSSSTALEYAKIGSYLDPDEIIRMGIISPRATQPKWREITYSNLSSLKHEIERPISAHGSVQGLMHSWFKEARDPYFQIRELSSDNLIKVFYSSDMYDKVARSTLERTTTLLVAGLMLYDRATRQATEMKADKLMSVDMVRPEEFSSIFGSAPTFFSLALEDEE